MSDEQLFGRFQGDDLEPVAYEALLMSRWSPAERKREPGLFAAKWWDYRTLHPVKATYLFAHLFTEQTRAFIREHINNAAAVNGRDWQPIKAGDIFEPPRDERRMDYWRRKITGVIKARQTADENGIPYPVYIQIALKYYYVGAGSYVFAKRNSVMIDPTLLYSDKVLAAIQLHWVDMLDMKVQGADHPRYLVQNDDGHPDHAAHRHWLEQQLATRPRPEFARARLIKAGFLPS